MKTSLKRARRTKRKVMGRPRGPIARARRNRVVVMLTDDDFRQLKYLADAKELPLGTVAYRFVAKRRHRLAGRANRTESCDVCDG